MILKLNVFRSEAPESPESQHQPEEDEVESVCERMEAQIREEMERLKAKAKKKSDKEKRRQQEYQDSAKEELKRELNRTFVSGNQCHAEVDRLKAQMRQEVEQLEVDLELRAEGKKVTEGQREREQVAASAPFTSGWWCKPTPLLLLSCGGFTRKRSTIQ